MKVKIFTSNIASVIENNINRWLEENKNIDIKDQQVTQSSSINHIHITITLFYEDKL